MTLRPLVLAVRPGVFNRLGVRLAGLLGLGAGLSAVLAMAAMLAMAWRDVDRDSKEEALQTARSVAFALQAPVSFSDAQGIRDAVSVLQARPQIRGAWVLDRSDKVLHKTGDAALRPGRSTQGDLAAGWLQVTQPIVAGRAGDEVGYVTLQLSLADAQRKLKAQALAAAGAGLLAALLALVVSQRLARRISIPVAQLAATASTITREQNYELRLPPAGSDEIGMAVMAFNHMLAEIERRGASLMELNRQLQAQAEVAQQAQVRAESASQAKTRFLANMSHELRSPLNGVIGAAQLLQSQGGDPARRAELVEIIRTSGTNLLGLIEHVLDLARIESGALELQPQDFNLLDCIEAAVVSSAAPAAAKGLRLSCRVDPGMVLWRHGDDVRLRQLVLNLLGNAVKFTAQGDVSVDVFPAPDADGRIQIQIRDTGIGIPAEALSSVFEPFQQADASTTRRFGGSGLGLAICRDLARLMGGEVSVQSIVGVGSCFTLEIPLALAHQAGAEDSALGTPVAWCEPHEPSARALAAILARLGCEAQRCHDLDALQSFVAACEARRQPPWFIVALDSELGRSLLAAALPRLDASRVLPIDNGSDPSQAQIRESLGLCRAMARPLLRSALASRLAQCRSGTGNSRPAALETPVARPSAQVLLAEDDPINQAVVRSMLQHAGYACTVVGNGLAALQQLARTRFDVVLMDWQMPEMDGLEATRRLRSGHAGETNRHCPVIALTANAFAEDRTTCLAAGMNDFVTKPVLASHLAAVLERWAFSHRAAEADSPAAGPAPGPIATHDSEPVYDPGVLARLPMVADGSDPQYAGQLLQLFLKSSGQVLGEIERGVTAADLAVVQRAVHSLKSSAAQVGAMALAGQAGRAESKLRQGALDREQLPPLLEQLRKAREAFADALPA